MTMQVPETVTKVIAALSQAGFKSWVVGGCVRDSLLGLTPKDWDICTQAKPEDVMRVFPHNIPTGLKHGTVTVVVGGEHFEVTTLRKDVSYSDGRRPDAVEFVDDITQDLARRDFTMNAVAYDVLSKELVDLFLGQRDLEDLCIRAVGNPVDRLTEDGLRAFRAIRFMCQKGFSLSDDVEQALADPTVHAAVAKVARERISDEFLKILACGGGIRTDEAFEILVKSGLLQYISPMLSVLFDDMSGDERVYRWIAASAGPDLTLNQQLAVLCLDLNPKALHTLVAEDLKLSRDAQVEVKGFNSLLREFVASPNETPLSEAFSDTEVRKFVFYCGGPQMACALLAAISRVHSEKFQRQCTRACYRISEMGKAHPFIVGPRSLAVNGDDLMTHLEQVKGGPWIRECTSYLIDRCIESPELNTREGLLDLAVIWVNTYTVFRRFLEH